jgi:tellurite methyltransferase
VRGIEPPYSAWEADVLPLNYTRAVVSLQRSAVQAFGDQSLNMWRPGHQASEQSVARVGDMAGNEFVNHDWTSFLEATTSRGPLEYFHSAMSFVDGHRGAGRQAVDLGCGGGADTRLLLARGWRVFAVDAEPQARLLLEEATPEHHRNRLEVTIGQFHEVDLPSADLVYAQFSLPFAGAHFGAAVDNAVSAIVPGGAFVGQFFGENDEWADDAGVAWVDRAWVDRTFSNFAELDVDERDHRGPYGQHGATKRWHFFHVRARC